MASIDKEDMDDDASPTTTTATNVQDGSILNATTNGPPVGSLFASGVAKQLSNN